MVAVAAQPWPAARNMPASGELSLRATVLRIREYQGIAWVHATSAMPRRLPEERVEAAVAMAGDVELSGIRGWSPRGHDL